LSVCLLLQSKQKKTLQTEKLSAPFLFKSRIWDVDKLGRDKINTHRGLGRDKIMVLGTKLGREFIKSL
jgi:3-deoxy-D-manno-octulosonic acid (KDO) 8-phosphate synthase